MIFVIVALCLGVMLALAAGTTALIFYLVAVVIICAAMFAVNEGEPPPAAKPMPPPTRMDLWKKLYETEDMSIEVFESRVDDYVQKDDRDLYKRIEDRRSVGLD